MTFKEIRALWWCTLRALAAVATLNMEAMDNAFADAEAVHAKIDARKGIKR